MPHYYAVWKGRETGIYRSWRGRNGCARLVLGYDGAGFERYTSRGAAILGLRNHSVKQRMSTAGKGPRRSLTEYLDSFKTPPLCPDDII